MGGFSTAYDLVSAEYGWTDDQIGDLPLARLRQITAAIQIRRFEASREEDSRVGWMTRNITSYISMGFMIEKGKENVALEQAQKLSRDPIEAALFGVVVTKADESKPAENKIGSYESFMRFAGGARAG